jgi:hypothetical protein
MTLLKRLFLSHPHALGESYAQHAAMAARFGLTMLAGGAACLVHALVPGLFSRTASDAVKSLYGQMKARQPAFAREAPAFENPAWQLEYEI